MIVKKTHCIIIECNIERAYKTPIYCDLKKIMTGYGPLPPSEGVINDITWANEKGERTVLAFRKELCTESIIERVENKYWKYQLTNFKQNTFFFVVKVEGEIWVKEITAEKQELKSTYSFHNKYFLTAPITYLFVKLLWSGLQKKGLKNMKYLAETKVPYVYPKSN